MKRLTTMLVLALGLMFAATASMGCGSDEEDEGTENTSSNDTTNTNSDPQQNTSVITCGEGLTVCSETCVNTRSDGQNCGGCGISCDLDQICEQSQCVDQTSDCTVEPCAGMTYCDESSGECLEGCDRDEQCGENSVCDLATNRCVCDGGYHDCAGICVPSDSPDTCGTRCEPCPAPAGATATCDDGSCGIECDQGFVYCEADQMCSECCAHGDCDEDSYCTESGSCESIVEAGYCLSDRDCESEEECDLTTLTCREIMSHAGSCNSPCGSSSSYASVCVNDLCVHRYAGTPCRPGDSRCGARLGCSPVTYTCHDPNSCSETVHSCGPGLGCGWISSTASHTCVSTVYDECQSGYLCHGLECVPEEEQEEDRCRLRVECTEFGGECFMDASSSERGIFCHEGECTPVHEVRCEADDDCGGSATASNWHCVEEIGYCAQ